MPGRQVDGSRQHHREAAAAAMQQPYKCARLSAVFAHVRLQVRHQPPLFLLCPHRAAQQHLRERAGHAAAQIVDKQLHRLALSLRHGVGSCGCGQQEAKRAVGLVERGSRAEGVGAWRRRRQKGGASDHSVQPCKVERPHPSSCCGHLIGPTAGAGGAESAKVRL